MEHRRRFWALGLVLIMGSTLIGCGEGNPLGKQAVWGKVTLDGVPLNQGTIQFSPQQTQGGISSGALIENGKYDMSWEKGLPPGKYLVRLFSTERQEAAEVSAGPPGSEPTGATVGKERIPARYNIESKQVMEITDGGTNEFNFDIQTK